MEAPDGISGSPGAAWIKLTGLVSGPVLGLVVFFVMRGALPAEITPQTLQPAAPAVGAVATVMAVWWLTEAIPLAATALLPLALFPLLGVMTIAQAGVSYGDPIVFLFMGGFLIQQAMERWGLHRRLALLIMLSVGSRPAALVAGLMGATAFLSMWVSNAATAAMMLPIGLSLAQTFEREAGQRQGNARPPHAARNFGICLMLGIAYSATIGGLGTPIGTAPNMIMFAQMRQQEGVGISFLTWMAFAMPLVVVLVAITWVVLVKVLFPVNMAALPGGQNVVREQWRALGRMGRGEVATLAVFVLAAGLWIGREPLCEALGWMITGPSGRPEAALTDAGVAIICGLLLFLIPVDPRTATFVLDWSWAARMPFGVLILFGGGLCLASALSLTRIDAALGGAVGGLSTLHPLVLIFIVTGVTVFVSELVSNTALVATFMPAMRAAAAAMGVHPLLLCLPMTIGASTAFMLPAGTPPNAIVFSSGYLSIPTMARAGIILNLVSVLLVTALIYFAGSTLLGIQLVPSSP